MHVSLNLIASSAPPGPRSPQSIDFPRAGRHASSPSTAGPAAEWGELGRGEARGNRLALCIVGVSVALLIVSVVWRGSRPGDDGVLGNAEAVPVQLELAWDGLASTSEESRLRTPTSNLDHCVRADPPCRFLLPGWIGGQETRGQEHLYRLGLLALVLDRILVLPNASHSELGACLPRPFTFYYDAASLSPFGISTTTQAEFNSYIHALSTPPTGQRVYLRSAGRPHPAPVVVEPGAPALSTEALAQVACMNQFPIKYTFASLVFSGRFADSQAAGTALVASLVQHLHPSIPLASKSNLTASASAEPPIIISIPTITPWWTTTGGRLGADLSIIHTLNPGALRPSHNFTHLAYAAAWAAATSLLTTKLAPFVAVHWRTERVPSRFFPACTKSLISTLSQLQREYPTISNVYLLTDYPLESLRGHEGEVEPHSASYGYVPRQVSKSMRVLVDWIEREGSKLALTTWTQEENVLPFANVTRELLPVGTRLKDLDLSLVGMLDKSVAMSAQIFVAGSQDTSSVVAQRHLARKTGDTDSVWNDVRFF